MFDIYQSRRKPQYELVVPHGTDIKTYDRWDGDWRRIQTTGNAEQKERESIAKIGHYLGRRDGYFLDEVESWTTEVGETQKFATFVRMDGKQVYINPKLVTAIVQKFDRLSEIYIVGGSSVEIELPAAQVVEDIQKASDAD
jgi:hypothetical protein